MSSQIKIARALRNLQNLRNAQKASADPLDPYMVGMFNGIELAMSVLTDREPEFIDVEVAKQIAEATREGK